MFVSQRRTNVSTNKTAAEATLARLLLAPMAARDDQWQDALRDALAAAVQGLELLINGDICPDCFSGNVFWETQDGAVLVDELSKLPVAECVLGAGSAGR